jgi:predicted secreted protein
MSVTGTGIPALTTVLSNVSGTITLSANATATATGVTLTINAPVYTAISELKTFSFSGAKNDTEDVTNSDSAGRAHEFIATLLSSGDVSISGNYVAGDAGQAALRAAFATGAILPYKIQLPVAPGQTTVGDLFTFTALVEENATDLQYDKAVSFNGKCKISGVITYSIGS